MKKIVITVILLIMAILAVILFVSADENNNDQPININSPVGIDYSCNQPTDCEIKNVGNQCGYYPLCVNKDFQPNPPELDSNVCGFPSINDCECVNNKCEGVFD